MKIPPIQPNIQTRKTFLTKVKNFFGDVKYTLRLLKEDVFEYVKPRDYVIVNGKKVYKTKYAIIDGKKIPKSELRFVNVDEADLIGVKWLNVKYYPEDIEKMKNMNINEKSKYIRQLIEENKFYYDNENIITK